MSRLNEPSKRQIGARLKRRLAMLRNKRRWLAHRLATVDSQINKLRPAHATKVTDIAALDRWLDELADGLSDLPALPVDFSRADVYDDHD